MHRIKYVIGFLTSLVRKSKKGTCSYHRIKHVIGFLTSLVRKSKKGTCSYHRIKHVIGFLTSLVRKSKKETCSYRTKHARGCLTLPVALDLRANIGRGWGWG